MKTPPPEAIAELVASVRAREVRAFARPLPIDSKFFDRATPMRDASGRVVRVAMGPQARGHLGVFDWRGERAGWELAAYSRSPWAVVKAQYRRVIARMCVADAGNSTTFTDTGGAARTLQPCETAQGATSNVPTAGIGSAASLARYGSSAVAATDADNNINTQLGADIDSATSYDDVNFRVSHVGARVHTEAAATGREIAALQRFNEEGNTLRLFMIDRTVIADVAIGVGQTVTVSYEFQF